MAQDLGSCRWLLERQIEGAFELHMFGGEDAAVEFTMANSERIFMFVQDSTRQQGKIVPAWKALRQRTAPRIGYRGYQGDFHVHVIDAFAPTAGALFAGFSFSQGERDFIVDWGQLDPRIRLADKMKLTLDRYPEHRHHSLTVLAREQLERWQAGGAPPSEDFAPLEPLAEELVAACGARHQVINVVTPRQFEAMVAAIFRNHGFTVELTARTSDGGYDVLAVSHGKLKHEVTLVEVKHFAPHRPVGVGIVRALYGTRCLNQADRALLVTSSYVSAYAKREFARVVPWELEFAERERVLAWCEEYLAAVLKRPSVDG